MLEYNRNGNTIKIKPSYTGLATIFDKDILLYLASALVNAKNNGDAISKVVRFTTYDYIVSTNKALGGMQYKQMQEGLERLSGTRIQTNIKTGSVEITEEFGLIDSWKTVKEDATGKAIAVEVRLSDWFYNSIIGNAVLSIDRDYFRLRKPIERRLYELARKHCGNQNIWKIGIENLKDKLGASTQLKLLRFNLKAIAETNHLPEYAMTLDNDVLTFSRRIPYKGQKPEQLPVHISANAVAKFVRDNPSLTRGKTEREVHEMIEKAKKRDNNR